MAMARGGDQRERRARFNHLLLVFDQLRKRGSATREELATLTGLTPQTVGGLIREREDLFVIESLAAQGRPKYVYRLNPGVASVIGIDVSRTRVRVAIADLDLEPILAERTEFIAVANNAETVIDLVASMVRDVLDQTGRSSEHVMGVGVALPAPVASDGHVSSINILKGWGGRDVEGELSARLGLPVEVNNDANLGALGELALGAASGCRHVLYIQATTGIGCGLIVNGKLYRGARGMAGEAGHMVFDWQGGHMCVCGNRGCLETVAGSQAIAELLRVTPVEGLDDHASLEDRLLTIIDSAQQGNAPCRGALGTVGAHLGVAVANLCNVLDPERVVIGSTLARADDIVLEPLRESVRNHTKFISDAWDSDELATLIVPGRLQDRAEVYGAMVLVLRGWNERFVHRLRTICDLSSPA
jgi:predicted NBD/HSP70 family sugar kinase